MKPNYRTPFLLSKCPECLTKFSHAFEYQFLPNGERCAHEKWRDKSDVEYKQDKPKPIMCRACRRLGH